VNAAKLTEPADGLAWGPFQVVPSSQGPRRDFRIRMDFAGWFEAYLCGRWHTFDPRNNMPRVHSHAEEIGDCIAQGGRIAASARSPLRPRASGQTLISSGLSELQSGGLREPQPKNLLGLIDAAELKLAERFQASVTTPRGLSKP
jgi:hypothetical protein